MEKICTVLERHKLETLPNNVHLSVSEEGEYIFWESKLTCTYMYCTPTGFQVNFFSMQILLNTRHLAIK